MAMMQREPMAELTHWEPFRSMERLQQEMNSLFSRFLNDGQDSVNDLDFVPSAEIKETPNAIQVNLEVPGMEAKDLDVQVTETSVLVKGERQSESKTEEGGIVRSEFKYGKFERQINLPAHVKTDSVKAEYKNGMLYLTLSKVDSEQRKAVKIQVS
ncbi:MAG: Hsp20/alpha crystallin family protein [Spirulina sp.]